MGASGNGWKRAILGMGAVGLAVAMPAGAAGQDRRPEIWEIELGSPFEAVSGRFGEFACGSNGGPPAIQLTSVADFAVCPPDALGLREVYFRYDREADDVALALEETATAARGGTTAFGFPVIATVLLDEAGAVRGKRVVTDPRHENATPRTRDEFWTLGNLLIAWFGPGWTCTLIPAMGGEHAGGDFLVKRRCEKTEAGLHYRVEQEFLQRAGQSFIDPHTGAIRADDFSSESRFTIMENGALHAAD